MRRKGKHERQSKRQWRFKRHQAREGTERREVAYWESIKGSENRESVQATEGKQEMSRTLNIDTQYGYPLTTITDETGDVRYFYPMVDSTDQNPPTMVEGTPLTTTDSATGATINLFVPKGDSGVTVPYLLKVVLPTQAEQGALPEEAHKKEWTI